MVYNMGWYLVTRGTSQPLRAVLGCRKVATSPLGNLRAAFDTKPLPKTELNWWKNKQGLFQYSELCDAGGFLRMRDDAVTACHQLVAEACSSNRRRKMVLVFDELSDTLCKVADLAEFIRLAHPDPEFQRYATEACVSISNLVEQMNTNLPLYSALESVVNDGDQAAATDEIDRWVARLYLHDFQQSGIQLSETDRQTVVRLTDAALQAGQRFLNGTHMPSRVPKDQVPLQLRHMFQSSGGMVTVAGTMAESSTESYRELAYKLYMRSNPDQQRDLNELLAVRHQLAQLCGFQSFAHRTLRGSLAGSPDQVAVFLDCLRDRIRSEAQLDFQAMQRVKRQRSHQDLAVWDVPYITQLMEKRRQQQLEEEVETVGDISCYFSLGSCVQGLSHLFSQLFGISLHVAETTAGELWSPDVHKLAVVHESEGLLGHIYCDLFHRAGKPRQDCHFTVRGGRQLDDTTYQLPVVVLMLSLPPPGWSRPSLLSHAQLEVLFHEMGHAMHSMLGRTRYQHVTGTRCSTDFAEVPSVLLERFAGDARVLRTFASHYRTGQPPPDALLHRLCHNRTAFPAAQLQQQLLYSAVDQRLHSAPIDVASDGVLTELQGRYYGLPAAEGTSWHLRFGHLVGYGARYYAYLMARAVASSIWREMFQQDPFNRSMGERYRRECLSHGGGVPAERIVTGLLQHDVTPDSMAQSVLTDVLSDR